MTALYLRGRGLVDVEVLRRGDLRAVVLVDGARRTVPTTSLREARQRPPRGTVDRIPDRSMPPARPPVVKTEGALDGLVDLVGVRDPATLPIVRSSVFLAYVRTLPCAACSSRNRVEAHHWGSRGKGRKATDAQAVPLCKRDHDEYHGTGRIGRLTPRQTREAFALWSVRVLTAYLIDRGLLNGGEHGRSRTRRK